MVDMSASGHRVSRDLDQIIAFHAKSLMVISDDGIEMTSHVILGQQEERGVEWYDIASGKPQ